MSAPQQPTEPARPERFLVIIPTYNEAENLELVVDRVRASAPALDVLVVDDASPDGTGDIADKIARHDASVHVLHRAEKTGLGAAYLAGFTWGLDAGYDVLIEMDADGSHLPEQLPRLLDALPGADLVLGARWVPGGRVVNWPRRREWLSRGGNTYARALLGLGLHDATGGFRAFRRTTLEGIDLSDVSSQGYCFQVDLARRTLAAGFRVVEVPITFVERVYGESKMTGEVVREALVKVTAWGARHRLDQARRLVRGRG
ncbi:MAG TPA: polyprenol monophosphomannose synthase [Nocardioidaceae bacterium]